MLHLLPVASLTHHLAHEFSVSSLFSYSAPSSDSTTRQDANFHFARVFKGDTVAVARVRHEHYLFSRLKLRTHPGVQLHVLEIGCGIGSAAFELAEYANVTVIGIDEDVQKVRALLLSKLSLETQLVWEMKG